MQRLILIVVLGLFFQRLSRPESFGEIGHYRANSLVEILNQELIHQGYRVLYIPCSLLVQNLLIAKRDLNLQRLLKRRSP